MDARDRLIVALDVPSVAEAEAMIARLGDAVSFYKIGYQLGFAGGLDFARALAGAGKQIFLDLKLHDIGNTVARGVESVARLGATFLTVHAYPQTMHAAVDRAPAPRLRILAVTVLTSYDDADLAAAGYDFTVPELVAERAAQARDIGVDGLVCSAEEAANLRAIVGAGMVLVTPGIRPAGAEEGDQKRIMTPAAAIAAGADSSGGRPADPGSARPEGRGRGDRRRDRGGGGITGAMPKGYWIPHLDVSNPEGFQAYRDMADAAHKRFGSKLLARGGRREVVEGKMRARNVLREFNSYDEAQAFYRGPEYSRAHPLREPHSACDFLIVEGYDGPQPPPIGTPPAAALKGYWIVHLDVTDPGRLQALSGRQRDGVRQIRRALSGARRPLRDDGRPLRSRTVVLEFPSYEAALACYRSPDYQAGQGVAPRQGRGGPRRHRRLTTAR